MATITEFPFIEQIEAEAMELLIEARNASISSMAQPNVKTEISIRKMLMLRNAELKDLLCWVVAWVCYQKAVRAGELTLQEACSRHLPLDPFNPLPDQTSLEAAAFPEELVNRLTRTHALYDRAVGLNHGGGVIGG